MSEIALHQDICRQFAVLLSYPDDDVLNLAAVCATQLARYSPAACDSLALFRQFLENHDRARIEEAFTGSFDLQAACHPYIGYQLCGESQQRTFFMLKLQEVYRSHGFVPESDLPDHLSEVLRFMAATDAQDCRREIIRDGVLPALEKMTRGVETSTAPYLALIKALQSFLSDSLAGDHAQPASAPPKESLS